MADKLSIGALSPDAVYDALIKKGLTKATPPSSWASGLWVSSGQVSGRSITSRH